MKKIWDTQTVSCGNFAVSVSASWMRNWVNRINRYNREFLKYLR
jgi:hypothetical protein